MCSEPCSVKTDQIEPLIRRIIMAETIVMIHGMWGGGWYWENYKNFL
jgi:hypothetical protein